MSWIEKLGVLVVSVEYRLATEHSHPAPLQDCWAGLGGWASRCGVLDMRPVPMVKGGSVWVGQGVRRTLVARRSSIAR